MVSEGNICPVCGKDHDPLLPHNARSKHYRERFLRLHPFLPHGRSPAVWTEPKGEPIAETS